MIEIVGLLKNMPGFVRFASPLTERWRMARIAKDLASLRFWNDGIRSSLQKIADGHGGEAELSEMRCRLKDTDKDTTVAVERLKRARGSIVATDLGMPVADALDRVIWKKVGPDAIRANLIDLELHEGDPNLKWQAQSLLDNIDDFNAKLDEVHEFIRPKRSRT
jgi:hypothetical protein